MTPTVDIFVQNEAGSKLKNRHNETTLEHLGSIELVEAYPFSYGFIPGTRMPDGDCLDCYLITTETVPANALVQGIPVGVLELFQDGEIDHKVLAVLPEEAEELDLRKLEKLKGFIARARLQFPDTVFRTGKTLSQAQANQLVEQARVDAGGV